MGLPLLSDSENFEAWLFNVRWDSFAKLTRCFTWRFWLKVGPSLTMIKESGETQVAQW